MYYVSGYRCMWYHTESPVEWSATNGIAVNHEIQIFLPRHVGQFFMIESLLFEKDKASFATPEVPYNLIVVE